MTHTADPKNILVTGGSGLVGRSVVRKLLEAGFQVRALVHKNPPPAGAAIYAPNPASHQNDTRPGSNGTYGTDCGPGCDAECDPSTATADPLETDWDGDGVPLGQDNCPDIANSAQLNSDTGPEGDACVSQFPSK